MKFITFAIMCGVSGVGSDRVPVSVMEGDSVTLQTDVKTTQHNRIKWYFNNIRIAQITGHQSKICTDVQCEERFRDRLKLDHQTGSLTITNTRNTDSGEYKLQILSKNSGKIFYVTVTDVLGAEMDKRKMVTEETPSTSDTDHNKIQAPVAVITCALLFGPAAVFVIYYRHRKSKQKRNKLSVSVSVKEGDSVTLKTDVTEVQRDDQIMWLFESGDTLIAKIRKGSKETHDGPDGRFRDRLELNDQTGSLTITNTRNTHSGEYTLKSIKSGEISFMRYSVTVFCSISRGIASDAQLKPLSTGFDV
ncbi:uncharacterized protein LOC143735249 isoform X1 [Siphateles boraxobius]|uniref:uncharacterized protein LOC143735249 isoform X1 n=2 Tax=Siphateles boraxobius TaxID=180520 RepID=UPI004063091C